MRISDWSSDVCSSDLVAVAEQRLRTGLVEDGARVDLARHLERDAGGDVGLDQAGDHVHRRPLRGQDQVDAGRTRLLREACDEFFDLLADDHHHVGEFVRSEEHTSELQSLMRISYAVFCLKKKNITII